MFWKIPLFAALLMLLSSFVHPAAAQNVPFQLTSKGIPNQISASGSSLSNPITASAPALDCTRMPNNRPLFPPPIDSSQPDTIRYDSGGQLFLSGPTNIWGILRFTAPSQFELRCIYMQQYNPNGVNNGVNVSVYDDNGSGHPGNLISGTYRINGPIFIGNAWLDVEIDQPYPSLAAGQNFFVIFGPVPTGAPTQGWFLYIDINGNTESRSGYGPSAQGPWDFSYLPGDLIVRAGGVLAASPQALIITLTPIHPPIIIPPTGGNLVYTITIDNNTDSLQTPDVWTQIQMPDSSLFPIIGPIALYMPPNATIFRARDQRIPAHAPAGNYIYRGFIGDYPLTIVDSDWFPFVKLASNHEWPSTDGWISSGEPLPGEIAGGGNTPALQGDFTFHISPNPFNPTTVARYELRVASHVSLRVYDTAGRVVQILVDGWREAGTHEVTFDGSGLPTGIYFARLEAGSGSGPEGGLRSTTPTTVVQKMVLLK